MLDDPEVLPEPDDWLVCAPWFVVDEGLVVVALWFAETPLDTFWSPVPMFTPGLMFAPALTSVLLMPTFASTPTFGFTLTVAPPMVEPCGPGVALMPGLALALPEIEVCPVLAPWFMVEDEFTSVEL